MTLWTTCKTSTRPKNYPLLKETTSGFNYIIAVTAKEIPNDHSITPPVIVYIIEGETTLSVIQMAVWSMISFSDQIQSKPDMLGQIYCTFLMGNSLNGQPISNSNLSVFS